MNTQYDMFDIAQQKAPTAVRAGSGVPLGMSEDDMVQVKAPVGPTDLIIVHNAGFDRPFCEAFSPIFADKAWARRGFEGTKLGDLIGQAGYFHEGYRAVDDCHAERPM